MLGACAARTVRSSSPEGRATSPVGLGNRRAGPGYILPTAHVEHQYLDRIEARNRGSHGTRSRHGSLVRNVRPEPNSRRVRAARSLWAACDDLATRGGAPGGCRPAAPPAAHTPLKIPRSRAGLAWKSLVPALVVLAVMLVFVFQNLQDTENQFLDVLGQVPAHAGAARRRRARRPRRLPAGLGADRAAPQGVSASPGDSSGPGARGEP